MGVVSKALKGLATTIKAVTEASSFLIPDKEELRLHALADQMNLLSDQLTLGQIDTATAKSTFQTSLAPDP
jgi:hypothetical protein